MHRRPRLRGCRLRSFLRPDLGEAPDSLLAQAQQATVAGCDMTMTRWFPSLGPEAFASRVMVDLARDEVAVRVFGPDDPPWPPGSLATAMLAAQAADPAGLVIWQPPAEAFVPLLGLSDNGTETAAIRAALAEFATVPAREGHEGLAVFSYVDAEPARTRALSAAVAGYISRWCRPAS